MGGDVISRNDGDRHWISPNRVIELYKVDPKECRILDLNRHKQYYPDAILLEPREDGDYTLVNGSPRSPQKKKA